MPEWFYFIAAGIFLSLLLIYIRGKVLDSKIGLESKRIESIIELNKSFDFHKIDGLIYVKKHYDNKSNFNKIKPAYLMSSYVRNNLVYFSSLISNTKENRERKFEYNKAFSHIMSQPMEPKHNKYVVSKREYFKREIKIANQVKLYPTVDCRLGVYMSYSSPKGRVNLSKSERFSFDDIVVAFGSVSRTYLDKDVYSQMALVERGEVSDSLRYDILQRDGFKCSICGASSKEGAGLHVDHIIPISKGGKSVPSNLRTLCERCNVGKSDKLEDVSAMESETNNNETMICPECGAKLILRNGKRGEFYGCSGYPKCKYTKNI